MASDETPWGTQVGDDIAALVGPYPGTWTWAPSTEEIEIENAGQVIEVEAVFEIDETSYRIREHVGGGVGVVCYGPTIQADGVLSFRDQDGVDVLSVPVTAQRSLGETPYYYVFDLISPVADFSSQLTELSGFEGTSIRVLANWVRTSRALRFLGLAIARERGWYDAHRAAGDVRASHTRAHPCPAGRIP